MPVARVDLERVLRHRGSNPKCFRFLNFFFLSEAKERQKKHDGWMDDAESGEGGTNEIVKMGADRTLASLWQWRQPKTSPQQGATTRHPRL